MLKGNHDFRRWSSDYRISSSLMTDSVSGDFLFFLWTHTFIRNVSTPAHMLGVDDIMKDMRGTGQQLQYFWVRHGLANIVCSYWPSSCLLNSCSITISPSHCVVPLFLEVSHCIVVRAPPKDLTVAVWDVQTFPLIVHHLKNSNPCHVGVITKFINLTCNRAEKVILTVN